jgi:predicted metal-dependent hydrolase
MLAERDEAISALEHGQAASERRAEGLENELRQAQQAEGDDGAASDTFEQDIAQFYAGQPWRQPNLPTARRKELLIAGLRQRGYTTPAQQIRALQAYQRAEARYALQQRDA